MDPSSDQDTQLLDELRRRRAELRDSMTAVEHALASPSGAGEARWAERLRAALVELAGDFSEHVAITEGADGLYRELEMHAPRLAGPVGRLSREHDLVSRQLDELLRAVGGGSELEDVEAVRRAGTELLVALMHHRQRGADLVFEAYQVDVGGET